MEAETTLLIHFHWNQDRGPTLYGFADAAERAVFQMIIEVPKIGPSIALQLLSQASASLLLDMISGQQVKALSSLNGIGPKKAEQLVHELKGKASTMAVSLPKSTPGAPTFHAAHVSEALHSLGYSKQEIAQALSFVHESAAETPSFDVLLRSALSYLAKTKSF